MKIKKKSGSKTENLRNLEAQPKQLVSYKKKRVYYIRTFTGLSDVELSLMMELLRVGELKLIC